MASYGENLLKKYGWNEGEGVGKNNQGIVNPIKASFKFDNAGVGFDRGEEFTVNWWEHLFNHTAKKIKSDKTTTENDSDLNKEETLITEKKSSLSDKSKTFDNKALYYSRFQKAGTLENGCEKFEEKKVDEKKLKDEEENAYDKKGKKIVSDEDLFKICEGRTAHKGARHGLKMNGKLARIMEQEQQQLQKLQKDKELTDVESPKKSKKNKHTETLNNEISNEEADLYKKREIKKNAKLALMMEQEVEKFKKNEENLINETNIQPDMVKDEILDDVVVIKKKRKNKEFES